MKMRIFFLFLMVFGMKEVYSVNDTLRMYDPKNVLSNYYNPTTYPTQVARFDLPFPAIIKGFLLEVSGDPGSSFKMQFLGHEGGVALISLFNDLIPPKIITKVNSGQEKIWVPLDSPYVRLDNTQFFLAFSDFKGLRLITDRTDHPFSCKSSSGGDYYYQYGISSSGQYQLMSSSNRAFAIDVILEYPSKQSSNIFRDVTAEAGFPLTLSNASIAAADYNQDGFMDLLVSGRFFENNKNGTFTDLTATKGIINKYSGVSANAFVDMDNDGDLDIILFGGDTSVLFINQNGSFTERTLSLPNFKAFLSFSFADINNDQYPDLFVSQLWQTYPEPEPNYFFYNTGNLDFTDNTNVIYPLYDGKWNWPNRAWDPGNYIVERNRNSRGSQWIDYDNDGDLDLYVTNYFLQPDELYKNNGNGTFTDICQLKGIDVNSSGSNHGTGVDWYDYDNDGDLDLLLPQFAHPRFIGPYDHRGTTIYRNQGPPDYDFTDMVGQINNYPGLKAPIGIELEETHAGGAWGDVNNDGLADFLMTVFYGCRYINFYEQQTDHTFQMKTFDYGLWRINTGTDLVWLDYDNDGRLDLACGDNGQFRLFKNDVYNSRRWLELDLMANSSNKYAIGARAYVYAGGKTYMQEVCAGRGQKMQKPYRLHFGLNYTKNIDSVVVVWPSKPQKREVFKNIQSNKCYKLSEGGNVVLPTRSELPSLTFSIFPNPASEFVSIQINNFPGENVRLSLLNSLSQTIDFLIINTETGRSVYKFNLENLPQGLYFIKAETSQQSVIEKLLIIR
ncbi:MAG TPA: FG-GAP-like repeat-containing protein [Bacteroidia bacterium]|nr:FG-GAP-like repeat-containing protein [Bacteroidia bacterium]HRS59317.1 FG-GAP-like repeat-containing protein [Bacteroidia bacterium]HRU68257.1 FG-GAP-like repeat-containing protein [Bacteroidia bacterium]